LCWRHVFFPTGDAYQDGMREDWRKEWSVANPKPYLLFVKTISSEWPRLKLLADFLEVGTIPNRWRDFDGTDKEHAHTYSDVAHDRSMPGPEPKHWAPMANSGLDEAWRRRVERTHVSQIEYLNDGTTRARISLLRSSAKPSKT
jgi:hypothetical protein